jgi:TRAP-type C4-dicarboxylate transport system substrate-binding protein
VNVSIDSRFPARGPRPLRRWRVAALVASILAAAPAVRAAEVIKIATLAPQGSIWDTTLREMGATWTKQTAGRVELRVYPGGVAGDESDVLRKIRLGQFQGAALTGASLAEIEPAFRIFTLPMLFDSWQELDHVLGKVGPDLVRRLEQKGYVLLHWGHGGWVHLFSRAPVATVEDLKRQKMFVWAGDDAAVQQWRKLGFQPVALAATDILLGLQTKMIDVVPTTPIAALSLQWFRQTPHMLGMGFAPLAGGTIVTRAAWEKLTPADREALRAAAATAGARLAAEVPKQDAAAIEEMRGRGLTVATVGDAERAAWRKAADEFAGNAREQNVPPEVLAAVRAAITEFRAGGGKP